MVGMKRCLLDILWVHSDLVVARLQVQLGEVISTIELIQELIDN
jgi:Ni,Fe-hydrogenase III large subunit